MKYFKIVDGAIELDKETIALYPLVHKIISRDRGGKVAGDPDGRLKRYAFREFAYVYFRCDFEAYPSQNGMTEKEAHVYAVKNAKLDPEYKPDDVVKSFMQQYEIEHLSPAKRSIKVLIRVFTLTEKLVAKIEQNLTESLNLPTLTAGMISELLTYQKQLIEIATGIPGTVIKLKMAMNLLEQEDKMVEIGRGGGEVSDSMRVDNEIEN